MKKHYKIYLSIFAVLILLVGISFNYSYADKKSNYESGLQALQRGDTETAKGIFKSIFTNNPRDYYAPYSMYQYARLLGNSKDVLFYLNKIISEYKDFGDLDIVYNDIGTIHFLMKKYELSKKNFYRLYKDFPKSPLSVRGMFYVGKCFFNLGDFVKALKWYEALYKSFPNNYYASFVLFEIGFLYEKSKDYDRALMYYEKMLNEYPYSDAISKALYRKSLIYGAVKKDLEKSYSLMALILVNYSESFEADFVRKRLDGSITEQAFINLYYDQELFNQRGSNRKDKYDDDYPITIKGITSSSNVNNNYKDNLNKEIDFNNSTTNNLKNKNSKDASYFIQLGAFKSYDRAENYSEKVNKNGFDSVVIKSSLVNAESSKDLNLVIIGFFTDLDRAKEYKKALKAYNWDSFISIRK